jgi:hypothetical protein
MAALPGGLTSGSTGCGAVRCKPGGVASRKPVFASRGATQPMFSYDIVLASVPVPTIGSNRAVKWRRTAGADVIR